MIGLPPAFFAAHVGFNFGARKNEPIVSGIVGGVLILVHFQNLSGIVELMLFGGATLGLDLAELIQSAFELPGEASAVSADVGERPVVLAVGQGHGESSLGLRMAGTDAVLHFSDTEREEVGLDGRGAVDLPGGVEEGLDERGFGGAFGLVFSEERLGVSLVRGEILGGQDDGLAC